MPRSQRRWWVSLVVCTVVFWGCAGLLLFVGEWLTQEEPNYTLIEDGLYLGGYVAKPPPGVRAVLNVSEGRDPYQVENHRWEPIREAEPPSLDALRQMVEFVDSQRRAGITTYVHCRNGVSRSGMVTVAYLMSKNRWTRDEALDFVRTKRPSIRPSPVLMQRLLEWESRLQGKTPATTGAADTQLAVAPGSAVSDEKFPAELVKFSPYERNPVFTAAGPGHWDVRIRERGWILRQGEKYHLWYTGYDGTREGLKMLGYATSADGLSWTRHAKDPIYREHWVEDMMVVPHEGTYYMFAEGRGDQAQLLSSKDGVNWKRHGQLDVRRRDGRPIEPGPYGTPTAWFEDGTWRLFYERSDKGVWLATSKDMKVWTNVDDEPVLRPGPAAYEAELIALNQIVKHKRRYYAYYHGSGRPGKTRLWCTCVATSTDLVHWEKYPGNPLLPLEANKSSGILVHDGKQFRLYTMHDQVHVHFPSGTK